MNRYKDEPSKEEMPMAESLKLTIKRTLPYWNNVIVPQIKVETNPTTFTSHLDICRLARRSSSRPTGTPCAGW